MIEPPPTVVRTFSQRWFDWFSSLYNYVKGLESNVVDVTNAPYNAVGDGVTDDTAAIQAAIDTGKSIIFPSGVYLVSSELTVSTTGQLFEGTFTNQSEFTDGPEISFSHNGNCFLVTAAQVGFHGIRFTGTKAGSDIAIRAVRLTNTDDCDLRVVNCLFEVVTEAVSIVGRGLRFVENVVAKSTTGITSSWPTSGTADSGDPVQALPLGYRAYRIQNNRFHGVTTSIKTTNGTFTDATCDTTNTDATVTMDDTSIIGIGMLVTGSGIPAGTSVLSITNTTTFELTQNATATATNVSLTFTSHHLFRGALISGNQVDIGQTLFFGGITDSVISSNVVDQSNSTCIYVEAGGSGLTITNNTLTGTDGDITNSPANAIWFTSDAVVTDTVIANNIIRFIDDAGIRFQTSPTRLQVTGNVFTDLNQSGGSFKCIDLNGQTVTDSTFIGNSFDPATQSLLYGTITDGTGNTILSQDEFILGALTATRKHQVEGATGILGHYKRTDNDGAVGVQFTNTAGTMTLYSDPSGSETGFISSGGNGTVDLGASSFKWKDVYADTLRSTTVTFANLPTPAEGMRAFCTDSTVSTFGATVAGGGSNNVPVYYDGSNWLVG